MKSAFSAEACHVVETADDDALVLLLLEERRGLVDHRRAVVSMPGCTEKTEIIMYLVIELRVS